MSGISFIEDVYIAFAQEVLQNLFLVDSRDLPALNNFYIKLSNNEQLTEAQSKYVLRLLKKYAVSMKKIGMDYENLLDAPAWREKFRVLDLTKSIYASVDKIGQISVCIKFPFKFKSDFEKEFLGKTKYRWDHDQRINIIDAYDINIIALHDFCVKNGFEIDDSFLELVSQVEEIWEKQYDIIPYSVIENDKVVLKNLSEDAENYWNLNRADNLEKDLFLAKTMGYQLKMSGKPSSILESIVGTENNNFWIKEFDKFFDLYKSINESVAVILDSGNDTLRWLEDFIHHADEFQIPRSDIKVCFRENKDGDQGFNEWVKTSGLGGKIDSGKIFIFRSKPAKWLFNGDKNVKIVVTNSLFPSMSHSMQQWFQSRPCVIYLGSIKASQSKDIEIVQL